MQNIIKELHECYSQINKTVFDDKLPKDIVILLSSKGTCSKNKKWELNNEEFFQLATSIKSFTEGREEFLEALLIQMIHLQCKISGIKDILKGKCTQEFKLVCNNFGVTLIDVGEEGNPAYSDNYYKISDELKDKLSNITFDETIFDLKVLNPIKGVSNGGGSRKPTFKYKCPCGKEIKSSIEDLHVVCKECNEEFERE